MTLSGDMNMAVNVDNALFKNFCDNYNEVRDQLMASNKQDTRTLSMSSSKCDEEYVARVQRESNRMVEDDYVIASDSPQLKYTTPKT